MPPQTTENATERRLFERFSARFPTKFKDSRNDFGTEVFLRDASATGARFVSKDRFFLEDRISLEIELPDGKEPMVLSGRVVWVKHASASMWDIGLQLAEINFIRMARMFKFTQEIQS